MKYRALLPALALLAATLSPGCMGLFADDPGTAPAATNETEDDTGEDLTEETPTNATTGTPGDGATNGTPQTGNPVASFRILFGSGMMPMEASRGFEDSPVTLDASTSRDGANGKPVAYTWEILEDATVAATHTGERVENLTFESEGTKTVRLTVKDAAGRTAKLEKLYHVDLRVTEEGSHTWPKPVVNTQEAVFSYNVTVGDEGRSGYLTLNWTTAQAARITLKTPQGTPLVDQEVKGSEATVTFDDAASFASPGVYALTIKLLFTPSSNGVPVYTGVDDPSASFEATLVVYQGIAPATMEGVSGMPEMPDMPDMP